MRGDLNIELIGASPALAALRAEIASVAPTSAKVLITGESGAGKELVARAIHAASGRRPHAYVVMNCAGLTDTLLESELFGHVKGSFTGAYRDKTGRLELAEGGTIFLDEVGEMSLRMQALLLRFLEAGEVQKVGSERTIKVGNVRVISATNRDLRKLIVEGKFREDLFYRLNVIHIVVPPLRERRADIPTLVEHFLHRLCPNDPEDPRVAPDAMTALVEYPWPGNIRELENIVERIVVKTRGSLVTLADLPPDIAVPAGASLRPKPDRRHRWPTSCTSGWVWTASPSGRPSTPSTCDTTSPRTGQGSRVEGAGGIRRQLSNRRQAVQPSAAR